MELKKIRITEVAQHLDIDSARIRLWEKEFNINATLSASRARLYDVQDLEKFKAIKELLLEKNCSLATAKKQFKKLQFADSSCQDHEVVAASKDHAPQPAESNPLPLLAALDSRLKTVRTSLLRLRELLERTY